MRFRKGDVIYTIILSAVVHLFLERYLVKNIMHLE